MARNPSDDDKPLVYLARLSSGEMKGLYAVADAFPVLNIRKEFLKIIPDVVLDRLILAADCLKVAQQLTKSVASEADYRAAVNRGYYSIHHSIRAMMLYKNHYETDGHAEAIKELKSLLIDASVRSVCGLTEDIIKEIAEARNNRSVADYSPYASSRLVGTTDWITITGKDWKLAAEFNVNLAERMFQAALKFI